MPKTHIILALLACLLVLIFSACVRQSHTTNEQVSVVSVQDSVSITKEDVVSESAVPQEPITNTKSSTPSPKPASSKHVSHTTKSESDNLRGWDPASEDDMDDNGMTRYMENYDDEGWD